MVLFSCEIPPRPVPTRVILTWAGIVTIRHDHEISPCVDRGASRERPFERRIGIVTEEVAAERNGICASVVKFDPIRVIFEVGDVGNGSSV